MEGPDWPRERLLKVERNYTMEYIRSLLPELLALAGPLQGGFLGEFTARLIGMQFYDETAALLGVSDPSAAGFAAYLAAMGQAQGDDAKWQAEENEACVVQHTWKLMDGLPHLPPQAFDAWNGLWRGP